MKNKSMIMILAGLLVFTGCNKTYGAEDWASVNQASFDEMIEYEKLAIKPKMHSTTDVGHGLIYLGDPKYKDSEIWKDTKIISGLSALKLDKGDSVYSYPASTVVYIEVEGSKPNKDGYTEYNCGTGVLIGIDTVLTCAHIFYDNKRVGDKDCKVPFDYENVSIYTNKDSSGYNERATATKVKIDDKYEGITREIYNSVKSGETTWNSEHKRDIAIKENDIAILKLDKKIGKDVGWIGLRSIDATRQEWGTLYQFPYRKLKLPSMDKLEECLKNDAEPNNENRYYKNGVVIDYIEATSDKGMEGRYKGLFEINNGDMYSCNERIGYSVYSDKLLGYKLSADSGSSGGPIIKSAYDYSNGEYKFFVCGVHSGYSVEDEIDDSISNYGDLALYIKNNITGQKVNFNYDQSYVDRSIWSVKLDMFGYSVARAIDDELISYLTENKFSTGNGYNPYE